MAATEQAAAAEAWPARSPAPPSRESASADAEANADAGAANERARSAPPAVNLFEKIIRNRSDRDLAATAHEAAVVVPPRSAFLMSDIKLMAPLLQGTTCLGIVLPVLASIGF